MKWLPWQRLTSWCDRKGLVIQCEYLLVEDFKAYMQILLLVMEFEKKSQVCNIVYIKVHVL
jgi:hypothetical protein